MRCMFVLTAALSENLAAPGRDREVQRSPCGPLCANAARGPSGLQWWLRRSTRTVRQVRSQRHPATPIGQTMRVEIRRPKAPPPSALEDFQVQRQRLSAPPLQKRREEGGGTNQSCAKLRA